MIPEYSILGCSQITRDVKFHRLSWGSPLVIFDATDLLPVRAIAPQSPYRSVRPHKPNLSYKHFLTQRRRPTYLPCDIQTFIAIFMRWFIMMVTCRACAWLPQARLCDHSVCFFELSRWFGLRMAMVCNQRAYIYGNWRTASSRIGPTFVILLS